MRSLGPTGRDVSCVGLGEMPLSIAGRPDEADAIRVVHAALDAGMTWIDTADAYCLDEEDKHHGEELVRRALARWDGDADSVLVATKVGCMRPGGDWGVDGDPARLRSACERSLHALGVERIELLQLHAPDPSVPYADSVGALARLQEEGKVRWVGLSNVPVEQLAVGRSACEVVSVQNRLNCFDRGPLESGVVDACAEAGIAFLAHSPVGGHRGHARTPDDPVLGRVAARHGATAYEVALAWLLALDDCVLPIPGASRVESARSSARAADLELGEADRAELREAFGR